MTKLKMKLCAECHREFPSHMIQELAWLGKDGMLSAAMCPICAYDRINKLHGLPEGEPPPETAPAARALYFEARQYLASQERLQ